MIIFLDEERAYLHWVAHHRAGYVLDSLRKPTKRRLALHRSTCPQIKSSASKRTHWTTGRQMKICSLEREALQRWAVEQAGTEPAPCPSCLGAADAPPEGRPAHLTHLDKEVLSCVLEIATLHLDDPDTSYRLTVGTMAKCLAKSPGQLSAALCRLADDGFLELAVKVAPGEAAPANCRLLPTIEAMKTLPAFQALSDQEIRAELAALFDP
jgi:hypothetical protein